MWKCSICGQAEICQKCRAGWEGPPSSPYTPFASRSKPRRSWWPTINSLETARWVTRQAFWAAVMCASATAIAAILGASGIQPFVKRQFDLYALLDAILFVAIACGLWKRSRVAAVAGLSLYLFERINTWVEFGIKDPVVPILLILAFIGGIRGTFLYHKLKTEAQKQPRPLRKGEEVWKDI